jgi:hypothetical protein
MTLLERITNLQHVWTTVIPHLPAPPADDVALWCAHPDSVVEAAILRTAKRFSKYRTDAPRFKPAEAYRYTTAIAKVIVERRPRVAGAPTDTYSNTRRLPAQGSSGAAFNRRIRNTCRNKLK